MKSSGKGKERVMVVLLACSVFLCVESGRVLAQPTPVAIEVHRETMTARLHQVPLKAVLQELQQQTGLKYTVAPEEADRPISVEFTAWPLRKGLSRILAEVNHAISFDANGMPVQVIIAKKSEAAGLDPHRVRPVDAEAMISVQRSGPGWEGTRPADGEPLGGELSRGEDPAKITRPQFGGMEIEPPSSGSMDIRPAIEAEMMVVEPATGLDMEITFPAEGEVMEVKPPNTTEMNVLPGQ